jgi:HD-like signal output (HDOD) protein
MAISKLGLKLVRDLVISLSMKQLYKASNDVLAERFNELWITSTKTAAIAHLLASKHDHLDAEKAMLAGLIHNIGALPIILMAEDDDDLFDQPEALWRVVQKMQGEVGAYIFQKWHFPDYMIDVANQCYHFRRTHSGPADYIDVIQVALIEGSIYTGLDCPEAWSTVAAFEKLDINTESHVLDIEENKLIFDETTILFK